MHVGSVGGLVARGLVVERGEFEAVVTAAGIEALQDAARGHGMAKAIIADTAIAVTVNGLIDKGAGQRIATTIVDAFRIAAAADADSWEHAVDLAFAGRDNRVIGGILVTILGHESGAQDANADVDFIAVGPRAR